MTSARKCLHFLHVQGKGLGSNCFVLHNLAAPIGCLKPRMRVSLIWFHYLQLVLSEACALTCQVVALAFLNRGQKRDGGFARCNLYKQFLAVALVFI